MPSERQRTVDQACREIAQLQINRRIDMVIVHHTWEPPADKFRGIATVAGIRRFHQKKWPRHNDAGYHIEFGPNGEIYFCCPFNKVGAHAKGHNSHSIGVSYIADFGGPPNLPHPDGRRTPLDNPATYAGLAVGQLIVAALCERFQLEPEDVRFHNEFSSKTCPGTLMDLDEYRKAVKRFMDGDLKVVLLPGSEVVTCRPQIEDGVTRCDLRPLAEALGYEVIADHLAEQNKIYLRKQKGGDTDD